MKNELLMCLDNGEPIPDFGASITPPIARFSQGVNTAFGFPIKLPDVSLDLESSRKDLSVLLRKAEVKNFFDWEFGKHRRPDWNGASDILPVDVSLTIPVAIFADMLREYLGFSLACPSTFRLAEYNTQEGQSPRSKHLWFCAMDLVPKSGNPMDIHSAIMFFTNKSRLHKTLEEIARRAGQATGKNYDPDLFAIGWGVYGGFVHIDVTYKDQPWSRSKTTRYSTKAMP